MSKHEPDYAQRVLAAVQRMLPERLSRQHRGGVTTIMILGTPNVGKTTLLNALKAQAAKQGLLQDIRVGKREVGPVPGVTKRVAGVQVHPCSRCPISLQAHCAAHLG